MQTNNPATEQADATETAQQRNEALEEEANNAWRWGEHWRDQWQELATEPQEAGKTVGLTQGGELVDMQETTATSERTGGATTEEHYAAGLVIECFGSDSPQALRFAQFVAERIGLPWLADSAPTTTAGAQA